MLDRFVSVKISDASGAAYIIPSRLHMDFVVSKSESKDPDTAIINLIGLSKTRRTSLETTAEFVTLSASKFDPPPIIFQGEIVESGSDKVGADHVTEVEAEDTKKDMKIRSVSRTYRSGVVLSTIITDLANAGGVQVDVSRLTGTLNKPLSLVGRPRDLINDVCVQHGYRYQIIEGRAVVIATEDPINALAVPLVNARSGLVGTPKRSVEKRKGKMVKILQARSLLNEKVVPGGLVYVQFGGLPTRLIYVERADYIGSTYSNDFYVDFVGRDYASS